MNKNLSVVQRNLLKRTDNYLGTIPADSDGRLFIKLLHRIYRHHGFRINALGRNPNRKQFGIPSFRHSLPLNFATRCDLYGRGLPTNLPKYYLMTLGELLEVWNGIEDVNMSEENDVLLAHGFSAELSPDDRRVALRLIEQLRHAIMETTNPKWYE